MSVAEEARLSALDRVLDGLDPSAELAGELFSIVDVIEKQPALRRTLTDPSLSEGARTHLVTELFGGRVSPAAQQLLTDAAVQRWASASDFVAAIERQGVRALLSAAQASGALDEVEDEVFRYARLVDAEPALRAALSDRHAPVAGRQQLVADLLTGRTREATLLLAQRAVLARQRTYDLTLGGYLTVAAQLRDRAIAKVVVARPLTDEQAAALRSALSRQLGREIALQVSIQPEVLGGVRVSVGDEVIEGTVAGRLTDAARHIS